MTRNAEPKKIMSTKSFEVYTTSERGKYNYRCIGTDLPNLDEGTTIVLSPKLANDIPIDEIKFLHREILIAEPLHDPESGIMFGQYSSHNSILSDFKENIPIVSFLITSPREDNNELEDISVEKYMRAIFCLVKNDEKFSMDDCYKSWGCYNYEAQTECLKIGVEYIPYGPFEFDMEIDALTYGELALKAELVSRTLDAKAKQLIIDQQNKNKSK